MATDQQNPPQPLYDSVHELLRKWRDDSFPTALANLQQFQQADGSHMPAAEVRVRKALQELLSSLEMQNKLQADVLRLHFLESKSILETANQLIISEGSLYKIQAAAIDWLATRLNEREQSARARYNQKLSLRLEAPTNTALVGVDVHLLKLVTLLSSREPPWIIAIEGIGGIGKTALAHVLIRHMIGLPGYRDFAWVTARHAYLDLGGAIRLRQRPALTTEALVDQLVAQLSNQDANDVSLPHERKLSWLQERLKQQPHLIIVDNLETVLDLETLLPTLQQLCNPSRFLLTARIGLSSEPNIAHFRVPTLDQANSLTLLRQEAKIRDFPALLNASDALLHPIFATVGGNPLALRLVVGQLETDTIDNVLDDLQQGRGEAVENLYTYIYRRAYEHLKKEVRRVWLALTLVIAPLASVEMLAKASQQDLHDVRNALRILTQMNLVDCHGDLTQRTFSIHPLTRTFLEKQIGKWETKGN